MCVCAYIVGSIKPRGDCTYILYTRQTADRLFSRGYIVIAAGVRDARAYTLDKALFVDLDGVIWM